MRVLVTGGAGYIGSHVCVALAERGHDVAILDNFSTSQAEVLERIEELAGPVPADQVDVRDVEGVRAVMRQRRTDAVVHCAGLKAVAESARQPIAYFDNNVSGSIALLRAMRAEGVPLLVFSSSATVYGLPDRCPITEDAPLRVLNPYGRSKLMTEDVIRDACSAHDDLFVGILRYFNPVGAHTSGRIGEAPLHEPTNLMPIVCQAADGVRPVVQVFGGDYDTRDGTGLRDFIHVMDLADAHVAAIERLSSAPGNFTVNIGTGRGYTVLEVIHAVERASGRRVPYRIGPRRPGDAGAVYADPSLARKLLGWTARRGLDEMCRDAWRWQSDNPDGYASSPLEPGEMSVVA